MDNAGICGGSTKFLEGSRAEVSYGNLAAPRERPCHCLYRYPVPGHCLCLSCLGAYNRVMEEIRAKAEMRREAEEMMDLSEYLEVAE